MKTIAPAILLILLLGNAWGQSVKETPKLHTEEFRNYHNALQLHTYALLEKLHGESELALFTQHPAISIAGNAVKAKLLRELNILEAIQKETEEYFFKEHCKYTYCILGQKAYSATN